MNAALLALALVLSAFGQPKTVFMITDAEGVAGICRQEQTDPKNGEMRQLLTGEINNAVAGLFDGGATVEGASRDGRAARDHAYGAAVVRQYCIRS